MAGVELEHSSGAAASASPSANAGNANAKTSLEAKRWNVVYPVYINKHKTVAEGRKIAVHYCCDIPTVTEIAQVLASLGLPHLVEVIVFDIFYSFLCVSQHDKAYSRDFMQLGCVRVQLKQGGVPIKPEFPNRKFVHLLRLFNLFNNFGFRQTLVDLLRTKDTSSQIKTTGRIFRAADQEKGQERTSGLLLSSQLNCTRKNVVLKLVVVSIGGIADSQPFQNCFYRRDCRQLAVSKLRPFGITANVGHSPKHTQVGLPNVAGQNICISHRCCIWYTRQDS